MRESFGDYVARMVKLVEEGMGWPREKTLLWFRTENPLLGGVTPDDMLLNARHKKLERFIKNAIEENTCNSVPPASTAEKKSAGP